jgi:hypothetical protein
MNDRQRTYFLFESWPFRLEVTDQAVNAKVRFRGSVSIPLGSIIDVQQRHGSITIVTTHGVYPRWGLSTPERAEAAAGAIARAQADAVDADAKALSRQANPVGEKDSGEGTRNRAASPEGPWNAANAERDAGLFLRAVLYSMFTPDVSASAKAYATVIGRTVVEGNDKLLFVLLSSLTYFVAKVHLQRDDPYADPAYVPYLRLLAAHFMNAAAECLPGPNPPSEKIRRVNGARLAAETSQASMALVEALGIVGSSATEWVASSDS